MRSCFLVFLENTFPVCSTKRASSSFAFIFLSLSWLSTFLSSVMAFCSMAGVDIRTTFLAASCFPPSLQNKDFLFTYERFSLQQSLRTSCRFSTNNRFVAASQRLIFLWKYLRRSSFFFSTPVEKKESILLFYYSNIKLSYLSNTVY